MKKFFTLVFMVAMTIGAYAQQNVPDEIKTAVEHLRYDCFALDDPEFECGEIKIEGQNIVLSGYIDEKKFEGMGIKDALEKLGITEEDLARQMRKNFFQDLEKFTIEDTNAMYKYKYNLVLRYIGKPSNQQITATQNYWELPHK